MMMLTYRREDDNDTNDQNDGNDRSDGDDHNNDGDDGNDSKNVKGSREPDLLGTSIAATTPLLFCFCHRSCSKIFFIFHLLFLFSLHSPFVFVTALVIKTLKSNNACK